MATVFAIKHTNGEREEIEFPGQDFNDVIASFTDKGYQMVEEDSTYVIVKWEKDFTEITVEIMIEDLDY